MAFTIENRQNTFIPPLRRIDVPLRWAPRIRVEKSPVKRYVPFAGIGCIAIATVFNTIEGYAIGSAVGHPVAGAVAGFAALPIFAVLAHKFLPYEEVKAPWENAPEWVDCEEFYL
jgi:hypothetical protein